jgi:hypothetical protein
MIRRLCARRRFVSKGGKSRLSFTPGFRPVSQRRNRSKEPFQRFLCGAGYAEAMSLYEQALKLNPKLPD